MQSERTRSGVGTRLFALTALVGFVGGLAYAGHQGYRAATDSFVAPAILSPDNDLVLAGKWKMSELEVERARAAAALEALDADVTACDEAVARLAPLRTSAHEAVAWTARSTAQQVTAARAELAVLSKQQRQLGELIGRQEEIASAAERNLASGLITRSEHAREAQALTQMRVALLDNGRTQLQASFALSQARMAQESLGDGRLGPLLPEALVRQDLAVRIELELIRLEGEKRAKRAERDVVREKLAKIDEIGRQLRGRPLYRAAERSMDLAFVPYTQIDGVDRGSQVFDCVWGLVWCRSVGRIAEVVPGEVILPDPWGNQARGQYAVLELNERGAAKSKMLRVRALGPKLEPREQREVSSR